MSQYANMFQLSKLKQEVLHIMDINLTTFLQDTNSQEIVCSLDYKVLLLQF